MTLLSHGPGRDNRDNTLKGCPIVPVPHSRTKNLKNPHCGGNDGYLNIERQHVHYCERHKTKWEGGWNLFSSWRHENEDIWRANAYKLQNYMTVKPLPWDGNS